MQDMLQNKTQVETVNFVICQSWRGGGRRGLATSPVSPSLWPCLCDILIIFYVLIESLQSPLEDDCCEICGQDEPP